MSEIGKNEHGVQKPMPTYWDSLFADMKQGREVKEGEIHSLYDKWAADGSYEKSVAEHGYGALDVLESAMSKLFRQDKANFTILDVGACTGFAGQRLYRMGFRAIDALDPSRESLRVAEQKGVYRQLFNVPMTDEPLHIPKDTYDAVVLVGAAGPKHLPLCAFDEIIRLVKPGGYIVNLMRADFLEKCNEYAGQWEPMIHQHEQKGEWRLVEEKGYPCHFYDRPGHLHIFQVC